ncbi:MAG: response regulator [Pseudomonadota bacterium]
MSTNTIPGPLRVLIVEDDLVDRMACRRAFAADPAAAFALIEADSGQQGLALAQSAAPDCILLDYHLPDVTGLEFLARLQAQCGAAAPPVMMLTGADSATVAAEAMRRGARDYLVKDVDGAYLQALPAAIHRMLREHRLLEDRRQAQQALLQSQHALQRLSAHQENIKEQERKRIAQEIHDELGGLLTGIKAYISVAIERNIAACGQADPLLTEAATLAQDAIATVRRVITDLRPSVLDQLGVWAALEWHAGQVAQRSGLQVQCHIAPAVATLELGQERGTMLFRVVQEALTNVVRHAEARQVRLEVALEPGQLVLTVADDGKGIAAERLLNHESWGILGMHERSRHFAGVLTITGAPPGQGTTLQLRLPLENHRDA